MTLTIRRNKRDRLLEYCVAILMFISVTTMVLSTFQWNVYNADKTNLPMTNEHEFDAMYHKYMEKDMPMVKDIMEPANYAGFFVIKLVTGIVGLLLLVVSTITFASAIAYGLRPDLADEVHEVKQEIANGQQIPMDEPIRWLMRFMPDVKAASGVADDYEFENPTIGLIFRDNIWKFLILYTLAIALRTNLITTFLAKTGGAMAYGVRHYVDNTDMRGIINTWTSAGKDFNPQYNNLTAEERNKRKVFNVSYNAVKNHYPREREQEFLNTVGMKIKDFIESEMGDIEWDKQSFSASADIYAYSPDEITGGISETEIRKVKTKRVGELLDGIDLPNQDYYLYVTILAYDERADEERFSDTSRYGLGNVEEIIASDSNLTRIELSRLSEGESYTKVNTNSALDLSVSFFYTHGGSERRASNVGMSIPNGNVNVSPNRVTVDISNLNSQINNKAKELAGSGVSVTNIKWAEVQVRNLENIVKITTPHGGTKNIQWKNGEKYRRNQR